MNLAIIPPHHPSSGWVYMLGLAVFLLSIALLAWRTAPRRYGITMKTQLPGRLPWYESHPRRFRTWAGADREGRKTEAAVLAVDDTVSVSYYIVESDAEQVRASRP